jgi:hypothetical protein
MLAGAALEPDAILFDVPEQTGIHMSQLFCWRSRPHQTQQLPGSALKEILDGVNPVGDER